MANFLALLSSLRFQVIFFIEKQVADLHVALSFHHQAESVRMVFCAPFAFDLSQFEEEQASLFWDSIMHRTPSSFAMEQAELILCYLAFHGFVDTFHSLVPLFPSAILKIDNPLILTLSKRALAITAIKEFEFMKAFSIIQDVIGGRELKLIEALLKGLALTRLSLPQQIEFLSLEIKPLFADISDESCRLHLKKCVASMAFSNPSNSAFSNLYSATFIKEIAERVNQLVIDALYGENVSSTLEMLLKQVKLCMQEYSYSSMGLQQDPLLSLLNSKINKAS